MPKTPYQARTHTDEPIIWQLTPQGLQKTWDAIFAAATDLASKAALQLLPVDLQVLPGPAPVSAPFWLNLSARRESLSPGTTRMFKNKIRKIVVSTSAAAALAVTA